MLDFGWTSVCVTSVPDIPTTRYLETEWFAYGNRSPNAYVGAEVAQAIYRDAGLSTVRGDVRDGKKAWSHRRFLGMYSGGVKNSRRIPKLVRRERINGARFICADNVQHKLAYFWKLRVSWPSFLIGGMDPRL